MKNNNNNHNGRLSLSLGIFLVFSVISVIAMIMILIYFAFIQGQQNEEILIGVSHSQERHNEILEGVENSTEQNTEILRLIAQLTNDIFIMQKAEVESRQAAGQALEMLAANANVTIDSDLRRQLLLGPQQAGPS